MYNGGKGLGDSATKKNSTYPVTYNTFGSAETEIPLKTSAPLAFLSAFGHNSEKSFLEKT